MLTESVDFMQQPMMIIQQAMVWRRAVIVMEEVDHVFRWAQIRLLFVSCLSTRTILVEHNSSCLAFLHDLIKRSRYYNATTDLLCPSVQAFATTSGLLQTRAQETFLMLSL